MCFERRRFRNLRLYYIFDVTGNVTAATGRDGRGGLKKKEKNLKEKKRKKKSRTRARAPSLNGDYLYTNGRQNESVGLTTATATATRHVDLLLLLFSAGPPRGMPTAARAQSHSKSPRNISHRNNILDRWFPIVLHRAVPFFFLLNRIKNAATRPSCA